LGGGGLGGGWGALSQTYYDVGACHRAFADPYCPSVAIVAIATAGSRPGYQSARAPW